MSEEPVNRGHFQKGHPRVGGRKKGSVNKKKRERQERLKQATEIATKVGITQGQARQALDLSLQARPLAKDQIDLVLVPVVTGVLAHVQKRIILKGEDGKPVLGDDGKEQIDPKADLSEYREWVKMLHDIWKGQMPYELPRFGPFGAGDSPALAAAKARELASVGGQEVLATPEQIANMSPEAALEALEKLNRAARAVPVK